MCAYALIPNSARDQDIIRHVNVILSRERKPMTFADICRFLKGVRALELKNVAFQNPNNFECFEDGQWFVKQITKVGICALHSSKNKTCPGTIPFCTGLHICKFYLLSGKCPFAGQCIFGHDLTISHNMNILKEHYLELVTVEDLKHLFAKAESRTSVTAPRICKFYNVEAGCRYAAGGKVCPNLHICRHYIQDKCRYGRNCRRSHNILENDVKTILEKHGINTRRTPKEIIADLQEALMVAGSDSGSIGSSSLNRSMSNLHIYPGGDNVDSSSEDSDGVGVKHHRRQRGRNRKNSAKSKPPGLPRPPVSAQRDRPQGTQAQVGLPRSRPPASGPGIGQRPPRPSSAQRPVNSARPGIDREISTDQNSRQVICIFHLRGQCAFGESCRNFHGELPYQWLYKHQGEVEWRVLPGNVNLEMELTYSDPVNQEYYMDIGQGVKVVFKTMTGASIDGERYVIHRLSTSSSVEFERQPLTTEWVWYWKDQIGDWKKYGEGNVTGYKSNITSTNLEQAYIANPEGQLAFSTLGHQYILDYPKMVQRNLEYKTERDVCRRPTFISKQDFEQKKIQLPSGRGVGQKKGGVASGVGMVTAPPHWEIATGADIMEHCQIVEIKKKHPATRREYKEIEGLFCESMPSTVSVTSIVRIENGDLWYNYVSKKAKMLKKNNGKDVGERRLFHGTASRYTDAICRQGLDFRLSGQTSGTRYGKGSYFATTSKYSDCYTESNNKVMFVVKVLVGEYVKGKGEYVRPPSKDKTNPCSELYDSCVDDQSNPKIFVIFDNSGQVYPEYVIRYEYKYA